MEQDKNYIVKTYGKEQYEKQRRKLESVLPKRKGLNEITISPNTAFVKNLKIDTGQETVSLKDMFIEFCRKLPYQAFGGSSSWEVTGYVNNEQVYGSDKERNQLVRERRKRVANDLFVKFLNEELPDKAKFQVVTAFNREYNSVYRPDYSQVPIFSSINKDFKGKPLKLTSVQLAGIGRMTVKGVGVLAHEVGFGKTLSGVLAMHEAMNRGFAKKPLIVIPNDNILRQWVDTINEVLPSATVNELGNLGAKYDLTGFKVNDGEFTIVTYEGLKAMTFSDETYDRLADRFSYITEDLHKHQSERDRQKEAEKRKEMKGRMKRGTKASYGFEGFGFDWLTVDEVHNANHIVSKVRLDKSVASDFRSQSQRTSDLGMKTWLASQYIQEKNNGRNVLLLSATPFTNKPLEYYSILSLVANDMLRRKGFFNVDQFFSTFMEADNDLEIAANGRPVQKTNVRRFRNNGLFQQLLSEYIDIKGEEDNPDLVRPERRNKEYKIEQNQLTADAMAAVQGLLGSNDTVLQGIGHARAAAFSPYASDQLGLRPKDYKAFVEDSPKIEATVRMIEQNKKDRPDAGQIIYSKVGVEFFPLIRDYLVKVSGFKPGEVRIITGATSNKERVDIQTAFNKGEAKVVIGSPAIKEGLNLQGNTSDMYILSLPWNFTQLRQIEGRGWRQGNRWENIRINYMLTNDSIDVFMLQRLQVKQGLYNEAMKKGSESLDVSDIDTAELKTALITDPSVRAEIETVQERGRLQQKQMQVKADLSFVMRKYDAYNKLLEKLDDQKRMIDMYRGYAKNDSAFWRERVKSENEKLIGIEKDIEKERLNLQKRGVNVDDIQRQTEQAENEIASLQERIDNLDEFQKELTEKYRREDAAKAKDKKASLVTYLKEREAENKSGFYRIRPENGATANGTSSSEEGSDNLYRDSDEMEEVNERFNEEITRYQNGQMDKNEMFHLGNPHGVMRMFLPDLPIVMRPRVMNKASNTKHNVDASSLENLPRMISAPIFVFKRSDNALGILTEIKDRDGLNVCVAVELNKKIQDGGSFLEVNDIRSIHGRNAANLILPIIYNDTLVYADKEKGLSYLSSASYNYQQEIDKKDLDSAAKIVRNFRNPHVSEGNFRESDAGSVGNVQNAADEGRMAERVRELTEEEAAIRDAVVERLRSAGIEVVTDVETAQKVLDEANAGKVWMSAKKKRALETASLGTSPRSLTVVSSADGAKVLKNLDTLIETFEESETQPKTFVGDLAKALGASTKGSSSQYATFETKNGAVVTIRIANHNASTERMDDAGRGNAISIVVTPKRNEGIQGNGEAHIVEFYYNSIKLRKAEGKPLGEIVRSIKQALYSGEFKDTTGLAERQEVNVPETVRMNARRRSKEAEKRLDTLHTIDEAVSFVTGKPLNEVKAKRQADERRIKAEAKELYEKVLAGDFNDVTLRLLNNYLDHVTPNNPYRRPLSKRLPQEVLRRMAGAARANEVDALFSRICEGSVGTSGKAVARDGARRVVEKKNELLRKWAIASGHWHTDLSDFTYDKTPFGKGKDSDVYMSKDGKSVIKVSKGKDKSLRFAPDIDAVALFNYVFPYSQYEILGYGEIDGKFVKFLRQPFVDFSQSAALSVEERTAYMSNLGFKPINAEHTAFSNGTLVVADLQKGNIVRDKDGNVRVIDADVKLHTKDVGGNYSYPPVETDTELPDDKVREHRVYHGSGADFDAFDHSHMGEGDGIQSYGWGTYVTDVEGIAYTYAVSTGAKQAGSGLPQRILYTVEIPDDTGGNYLDWDKPVTKEQQGRINGQLRSEGIEFSGEAADFWNMSEPSVWDSGEAFYEFLNYYFSESYGDSSSQRQASQFLSRAGFTGIKYSALPTDVGREDGAKNYVIFNEGDLKITDRVRFFRTAEGEAYGFTVGGKVYIDPRKAGAETPIHEYAHLWASALRKGNPAEWQNVVGLMKGTPVWDEVRRKYPELETDDEIADEVLATYSGRRGAERLREEMRKAAAGGKGLMEKAEAVGALERVREALRRFWKAVADFLHIHYTSAEEVADKVMSDLVEGVNPEAVLQEGSGLAGVNARFNEELDRFTIETADNFNFNLGRPSEELRAAGVPDRPIRLHGSKVAKKMKKHGFKSYELKDLPNAVAHPIAVFDNLGREGNRSILTELKTDNGNFLVSIDLGKGAEADFDIVSSVFGKKHDSVVTWINKGFTRYVDKEKALSYLHLAAPIAAASNSQELNDAANIVRNFRNPQVSEKNFREGDGVGVGNVQNTAAEGRMVERVRELAEKLNLGNVEVVTDASTLDGKRRKAKGFYNKRTGKITIVVPNHGSVEDIEQTLLHEAVAHYGLRKLFGERFNEFLDKVYANADISIRRAIAAKAAKRGWDFRTATEEYLAGLAERTDFENAKKSGWWQSVKRLFADMLESLGFSGMRLSDNELRYVLWRSYENLKDGERGGILAEAADVAKQYELKVGNYAERNDAEGRPATIGEMKAKVSALFEMAKNGEFTGKPVSIGRLSDEGKSYLEELSGVKMKENVDFVLNPSDLNHIRSDHYGENEKDKGNNVPLTDADIENMVDVINHPDAILYGVDRNDGRKLFFFMKDAGNGLYNLTEVCSTKRGNLTTKSFFITKKKGISQRVMEIEKSLLPTSVTYSGESLSSDAKIPTLFQNPNTEGGNQSDDILFRDGDKVEYEKAMARDMYERRVKGGMYQTQEALQDSMLSVEEAMLAILKAEGRKGMHVEDIAGYENAYLGENRLSSVNQAEAKAFERTLFNPLMEEVGRLAKTARQRAELTDYMMAKHGLERNELMRRREKDKLIEEAMKGKKPKEPKPDEEDYDDKMAAYVKKMEELEEQVEAELGDELEAIDKRDFAGLTALTGEEDVAAAEAEAQSMVDDYEARHDTEELWERVRAVTRATLDKTYESGLISKKTYEDILSMYDHYIPLRGFAETTGEEVYAYVNQRDGGFNAPIKTAKGRKSKADDPFANMKSMAESAIMQGNRNVLVKQRFLNFALNHPSDLLSVSRLWLQYDDITEEWTPVLPDNIEETDTAAEVERKMQEFEERMRQLAAGEPDKYKNTREAPDIPLPRCRAAGQAAAPGDSEARRQGLRSDSERQPEACAGTQREDQPRQQGCGCGARHVGTRGQREPRAVDALHHASARLRCGQLHA